MKHPVSLDPKDKVVFEPEADAVKVRPAPSKVLRWYGSVTPRDRPEDFQQLREKFESGVAEEVISEG